MLNKDSFYLPDEDATSAVVMLHGYGANGADLLGLAPFFAQHLPETAFYAPDGPEACGGVPFGRQWFDIEAADPGLSRRDPHRFSDTYDAMYDWCANAHETVSTLLDELCEALGLRVDRIALLGFSQGTMMALHTGLRYEPSVAAIAGFSGGLLGKSRLQSELRSAPPLLLIHGEADDVVPPAAWYEAKRELENAGLNVRGETYEGLGHSINPEGATLAAHFLKEHLYI